MTKKSREKIAIAKIFFFIFAALLIFISSTNSSAENIYIRLIMPNGGERWRINETRAISWSGSNIPPGEKVGIDLYRGNAKKGVIAEGLSPVGLHGTPFYNWTVGQYQGGKAIEGTGYRIRVRLLNGSWDESDNPFELLPAVSTRTGSNIESPAKSKLPTQVTPVTKDVQKYSGPNPPQPQFMPFGITSPIGGEHWQKGQTREIRWNPGQAMGSIQIKLKRFGRVIHLITWGVNVESGKYSWNVYQGYNGNDYSGVPYDPGSLGKDRFQIIIMSIENAPPYRLYTESPGRFSIASIAVTSPGGQYHAGTFYLGDPLKITWRPYGVEVGLRLYLLWDNAVVGKIAENVPVQYDYNWTVGNYIGGTATPRPGGGYQIKVETMDGYYSALSSKFTILSK